ncbi:hypothetical protein HNV08_06395 [Winogradskyella eckloniae]|uniref:hypothetical protein n=1 Tax=Winogradskyella eckloniae TaxID=1089306 RepID=UPI001566AC93|nr:hypothetical protein [Winogradskyella eckloniae]NRD19671.1 hypothetical protein [Winogradskyella eckloniae]
MSRTIFIFFTLILFSCQNDVELLRITGTVKNKITNLPIANMKLKMKCWYYGNNSPDQSYTGKYDTIMQTDNNGEYTAYFKKGAFLFIETNDSIFEKIEASKHLKWSNYTIDIAMKPK